jgi:hypothetical protein
MTAPHTSLSMTLGVSLPSPKPFLAHIPILNSDHTYQHIHIYMTSTDPGHDGRVLDQGHTMCLRPCRFRAGYYEGGGRGGLLGGCTSQTHSLRFPNERGWRGFRPASWVVYLNFLLMPKARVAVCAGAQFQQDIKKTRGLEHPTPLRVYLRSLEDTSARTAHVRGQGLA